ncbi:hypothetical protein ACP70R_049567 [Stipagrostis hirtigluma subsp. patula]
MWSSSSKPIAQALCSACRRAIPSSSSTVRAQQATGSHLLRVQGYLLAHKMLVGGTSIFSDVFTVGSRKLCLSFWPKGGQANPDGNVRANLHARGNSTSDVTAECQVSILDRAGFPAYTGSMGPQSFCSSSAGIDIVGVKELSEMAARLVDDDGCLNVRCDVTVLEFDAEAPVDTD